MEKTDFVVRFAGKGGHGIVTAAEALAQAAAQVGYHVMTYATFPSQIMGGPTWAQTRIATSPVSHNGDTLDVLVALNREAYDAHINEVQEDGIVLYDSAEFDLDPGPRTRGIPFYQIGRSTGNPRARNMVVLGTLAHLVHWPEEYLVEFVRQRFSKNWNNDKEIVRSNTEALRLGKQEALREHLDLGTLAPPAPLQEEQILVNGNEALSLGALHAGVDFFIGYPISPATTILIFMEHNLSGPGKFVCQGSSEIESINAIVGAGYAGKKAMTSTAGPGLSLMGEGIGLAWMAEIPLVVANIQRGGPSSGLPTKTEQSDLLKALTPTHGDARIPIIAPGTVEECFTAAVHAFNWAERYQGPVILLSEMMLAERKQNIPTPKLDHVVVEDRQVYQGSNNYRRYEARQLSPMPLPGGPGAYVANGSEHDSVGDTTHQPMRHVQMTQRRFSKLKLLDDGTYERFNTHHPIAVMPWGGSKGPTREAYETLMERGVDVGWYYTMYLHPIPLALLNELQAKELVIVPELNYQGQLSSVLRSMGVKAESIVQYTGLPFKVGRLVEEITRMVDVKRGEKVAA